MAKIPHMVADIKGFSPSVESRNSGETFVVSGRNFLFDSKGPKSGFGSRLMCGGQVIEDSLGGIGQSIQVAGRHFLFTNRGCYQLSVDGSSWVQKMDLKTTQFPPALINPDRQKWTYAYLTDGIYFCHPAYGLYKYTPAALIRKTEEDIPGLPESPQAITETNGRLIVVGKTFVGWSGPSSPEDFKPAIGGAGAQVLNEKMSGDPETVAGFQLGFLIWSKSSCLIAEFIGGDLVFRFDRNTTDQLPLSGPCVESFPDGTQIICTKQGIHRIENASEPKSVTPIFNEFMRTELNNENEIQVRLKYSIGDDLLFVQVRDWTSQYIRTYALSVALDKWGLFSERHLGIVNVDNKRGSLGYVDSQGRINRFVETWDREVSPGVYAGLDSEIEIGYFRPADLRAEADSIIEMQELILGSRPHLPSWEPVEIEDDGIVGTPVTESEDFNGIGFEVIESTENWNHKYSLLNPITYNISVASEQDGQYDETVTVPLIAREQPGSILWALMTSGQYHRIRISAVDVGQFYHVRLLEPTLYYQGQLS